MDHSLDDSLNLESAIGVDFHSEDIEVSQSDITLDNSGHDESIPMEFEHIEEQPMLMDTGSEEIIEFMGSDQFTLQEYSIHDDQLTGAHAVVETSSGSQTMGTNITYDASNPSIIHVQAAPQTQVKKLIAQKPVAIAPRPPKMPFQPKKVGPPGMFFPIAPKPSGAPKPVALIANNSMLGKKMAIAGTVPNSKTKNSVLTQIGKLKLVMLPESGGQKIKLMNKDQATVQIIRTEGDQKHRNLIKSAGIGRQAKLTKVVMQAVSQANLKSSDQPAVLSKIVPVSGSNTQTHYVMQQRTVPINKADMVLLGSPSKQTVKIAKNPQVVTIVKSPNTAGPATTKKVVISANPSQNIILKTTAPPKTATINKDGTVTTAQGQQTQLHQINVPGKGIQYIRLITTPTSSAATVTSSKIKPISVKQSVLTLPNKYIVADSKTGIVQMSTDKVVTSQPPPLVLTGTPAKINKVTSKPLQKLVRIAPMTKPAGPVSSPRAGSSLLAPLETSSAGEELRECKVEVQEHAPQEFEVDFETHDTSTEEANSSNMDTSFSGQHQQGEDHPLIVVPDYKQQLSTQSDDPKDMAQINKVEISLEGEVLLSAYSDDAPNPAVEMSSAALAARARKACNCTKSQCLKLYCDCFANGEFCNRCNCNNCHNNLENEELRQKAIRGCLERNPNAFRPKIGKAKISGPDIIRRHNKGCNCKRSGCLKNYCECFEAKIACTAMCKCFGCRNVEDSVERRRRTTRPVREPMPVAKQPCSFMTTEVIEAVCQCLLAASVEPAGESPRPADGAKRVLAEFSRCLQDIISAAHQPAPITLHEQGNA